MTSLERRRLLRVLGAIPASAVDAAIGQRCDQFKLIRKKFDVTGWIDQRYVDAAIRDMGLQSHWPSFDVDGKPLIRAAGA